MKTVDVHFGCCVLNKKLLLEELRQLSSGGRLRLIAENTETMKNLIREIIEKNCKDCRVVSVEDENCTTQIIIERGGIE